MAAPTFISLPATAALLLLLFIPAIYSQSVGDYIARAVSLNFVMPQPNTFAREFLDAHNQVRAALGEAPLMWDRSLARTARRWSVRLSLAGCTMVHSGGPFGENLFWGSGQEWKPADAVNNWVSESGNYHLDDNSCTEGTMCGHYTQVVWNSTERVGCSRVECPGGNGVIITCNYYPPGNYIGEKPF